MRQGELVLLDEQDRSRWDQAKIREGIAVLDDALALSAPGPYQVQAAISALHAEAATPGETDWPQIAALYRTLAVMAPSPVVESQPGGGGSHGAGSRRGFGAAATASRGSRSIIPTTSPAPTCCAGRTSSRPPPSAYQRALALCQNSAERALSAASPRRAAQ